MRILIERKGQGCDSAWLRRQQQAPQPRSPWPRRAASAAQGLLALPMAVGAATS
jgi:hypothetical protein